MDDTPLKLKLVRRRGMKRMVLRVKPGGEVCVSAPPGVDNARITAFVRENTDWIVSRLKEMAEAPTPDDFYSRLPLATPRQRLDAVARMNALVRPLIGHYADIMGVGPTDLVFKAMRSRWGSCNPRTGRICLSVYLLLLPEWCAEHIVVHEMAHLLVPNHSRVFHEVMDRYFPRWREARALTRRICRGEAGTG